MRKFAKLYVLYLFTAFDKYIMLWVHDPGFEIRKNLGMRLSARGHLRICQVHLRSNEEFKGPGRCCDERPSHPQILREPQILDGRLQVQMG